MRYPEQLIVPMREDLTRHGVMETRTPEEVDRQVLAQHELDERADLVPRIERALGLGAPHLPKLVVGDGRFVPDGLEVPAQRVKVLEALVHLEREDHARVDVGPEEAEELAALRDKVKASYEEQTDIRYAAARLWVDAIIAPEDSRAALVTAVEVATRYDSGKAFKTGVFQV